MAKNTILQGKEHFARDDAIIGIDGLYSLAKEIESELRELHDSHAKGTLSLKEYQAILSQKVEGKTREQWLEHCRNSIERISKNTPPLPTSPVAFNQARKDAKAILTTIEDEEEQLKEAQILGLVSKEEIRKWHKEKIQGKSRGDWKRQTEKFLSRKTPLPGVPATKGLKLSLPLIAISLVLALLFFTPGNQLTGYVTITAENSYTIPSPLNFNESGTSTWNLREPGQLIAIRLNGTLRGTGTAKVNLLHENLTYILLDSRILKEQAENPTDITTSLTAEDEDEEFINITSQQGPDEHPPLEAILIAPSETEKQQDGIFNYQIATNATDNTENLCSLWKVNTTPVACHGSPGCCSFVGMDPSGKWDDTFSFTLGRYNSGPTSRIEATLISYDVDLSVPYSNIKVSPPLAATASFSEPELRFTGACLETCLLPGFNLSTITLLVSLENATIDIDSLAYTLKEQQTISRNPPSIIRNMTAFTLFQGETKTLSLSEFFTDLDGDNLTYAASASDGLEIRIDERKATLTAKPAFSGIAYLSISAYDGFYSTTSESITVEILETPTPISDVAINATTQQGQVIINQPAKWSTTVKVTDKVYNLSVNIPPETLM